jgi:hypothetical protein
MIASTRVIVIMGLIPMVLSKHLVNLHGAAIGTDADLAILQAHAGLNGEFMQATFSAD